MGIVRIAKFMGCAWSELQFSNSGMIQDFETLGTANYRCPDSLNSAGLLGVYIDIQIHM